MKHNLKVTLILVSPFLLSQIVGLLIINQYIDHKALAETGELKFTALPGYIFERPETDGTWLVIILSIAIAVGTGALLLLARFKKLNIWKAWYSASVIFTLFFALAKFIFTIPAIVVSLVLTFFKVWRTNIIVHNITEVLIYGGLAAIFVPIEGFTLLYAVIILALISIYDMYAVWKSKHMVTIANFTAESKVFAGLSIPYNIKKGTLEKVPVATLKPGDGEIRNAILGGGDIGFPLLFAGVVMKTLMITNTPVVGFLKALIIPIFTGIALLILFVKGEKNKFYPAMPFLSAGCIVGYIVLILVNQFV